LVIVAISALGTFKALAFGYDHMNQEMRHRKAISVARAYLEYWQGRIHTDFDQTDQRVLAGNLQRPEVVLLDPVDPATDADDVWCRVSYAPLEWVDQPTTGVGVDFWKIRVHVEWFEPYQPRRDSPYEVDLFGTMVPSAL
jgi:hypothetical protein